MLTFKPLCMKTSTYGLSEGTGTLAAQSKIRERNTAAFQCLLLSTPGGKWREAREARVGTEFFWTIPMCESARESDSRGAGVDSD